MCCDLVIVDFRRVIYLLWVTRVDLGFIGRPNMDVCSAPSRIGWLQSAIVEGCTIRLLLSLFVFWSDL